jgi:hypothetical protein
MKDANLLHSAFVQRSITYLASMLRDPNITIDQIVAFVHLITTHEIYSLAPQNEEVFDKIDFLLTSKLEQFTPYNFAELCNAQAFLNHADQ